MIFSQKQDIAHRAALRWSSAAWVEDAEQEAMLKILRFPPDETRCMPEQEAFVWRTARSAIFSFNAKRWRRKKHEAPMLCDEEGAAVVERVETTTAEDELLAKETDIALRRAYREAIALMSKGERRYIEHAYGVGTGPVPSKTLGVGARRKFLKAAQRNGVTLDPWMLYSGGVNPEVWGGYLRT